MSQAGITDLLRSRIGLDPDALGPAAVPTAVAGRMRIRGLTDERAYLTCLAQVEEFEALVEDLVVRETWFFRGSSLFFFLAEYVRQAVVQALTRPFRILSIPCSTGEEPYSMALALAETQVPPDLWTIDGLDVSRRGLEQARRGWYREASFRELSPQLWQRYFRRVEGGWEIDASLRAMVRFSIGNLVDPHLLAGDEPFDLIMCRNVLIYQHPAAREQSLATLDRLLAPEGLMAMGHAEPLSLVERRFQPFGPSGCFLFRRAEHPGSQPTVREARLLGEAGLLGQVRAEHPGSQPPPLRDGHGTLQALAFSPTPGLKSEGRTATPMPAAEPDALARAKQQADAGHLDEALASCQAHLATAVPSAELYALQGVIHQARQEKEQALGCFRKALYLDPNHREALTHLMLLCRQDGDDASAALLRRRLERTSTGGKS